VQLTAAAEPNNPPFSSAEHGPGDVKRRSRNCAPWDHKGVRQWEPALQLRDLPFEAAGQLGRHDHEVLLELPILFRIGCELGANREELALHAQDDGVPPRIRHLGAGEAERRNRFIYRAIGLGPRIGLRNPAAVEQPGFA
jgi:hypothetical protein